MVGRQGGCDAAAFSALLLPAQPPAIRSAVLAPPPQVLGEWRVKNEGLQPYHAAATALMRRFASFEARQVLREFNKAADALSNQAIDDWRSGVNRQLWSLQAAAAAVGNAEVEVKAEEDAEEEEGAAGGAAAAAAEGEGHGRGSSGSGGDAAAAAVALDSETAGEQRANEHEREGSDTEEGDSSSSSSSSEEEEEGAEALKRARLG